MDFDSPDVAKDFPGLYASESSKKSNESDFSDGDHDKVSKKDLLIGRKKDHKKDRGYAALEGESSPEDDETKSGSKSKKSKAFKFSTKNKERREKSRDKDKVYEKEVKDKEKDVKEDKDKKKEKDKKDKDRKEKKEKEKDKEKREKKTKHTLICDEALDLGDVQPVFGVSLGLSVERSKCHDNSNLPVVVRNCIDYLQEHGLTSEQLYKVECSKTKLQTLKKLYNNHEVAPEEDFDVPTACCLLKSYIRELPEPILTSDLAQRFEEASAIQQVSSRGSALFSLIDQLPSYNRILLSWIVLHLDEVTQHEKFNKFNAQILSVQLSPVLMMSHRLLMALLCHCKSLFPSIELNRYVPPLSSSNPNLPDTCLGITNELQKQESLLSQIHAEMNAGFVSTKREEQLWEVQRIITQLKRKLRMVEKKTDNVDRTIDEEKQFSLVMAKESELSIDTSRTDMAKCHSEDDSSVASNNIRALEVTTDSQSTSSKETVTQIEDRLSIDSVRATESDKTEPVEHSDKSDNDIDITNIVEGDEGANIGLEKSHLTSSEEILFMQMQYENSELLQFVAELQSSINNERADIVKLRTQVANVQPMDVEIDIPSDLNLNQLILMMIEENQLLEQRRNTLIREIFDEEKMCIDIRVQLAMLKV